MKMLLFYDEKFPYDGMRPTAEVLNQIQSWADLADAEQLAERLQEGGWDALIHLHGPYFPKQAWTAIESHLKEGGGWSMPAASRSGNRCGKWTVSGSSNGSRSVIISGWIFMTRSRLMYPAFDI